jgi:hypothetical protein
MYFLACGWLHAMVTSAHEEEVAFQFLALHRAGDLFVADSLLLFMV